MLNITNKIDAYPDTLYGGYATFRLRINRHCSFSVPCSTDQQFIDSANSLGLVVGPWLVDGVTYSSGDGALIFGANPRDPSTPQPVLVFVDMDDPTLGGNGAKLDTYFFLLNKAIDLVSSAQLILPKSIISIMQNGWHSTPLALAL